VLAQLETDELELALAQAKTNRAEAQRAVDQAEIAVTQAQMALTISQQEVTQAELAHTQAEASLTAAQFELDRIEAVGKIKDQIMKTEMSISAAIANRHMAGILKDSAASEFYRDYLDELDQELNRKKVELQKLLAKDDYAGVAPYEILTFDPSDQTFSLGGQTYNRLLVEDIQMKQQQVVIAQKSIEMAQQNIEKTRQNIKLAEQNLASARQAVEQANLVLEQAGRAVIVAQKQLEAATIAAPFAGVVADLTIQEGDYIFGSGANTEAPLYLVEPASLEVKVEIDEMDITTVQNGQKALINLEAAAGLPLEGKVTSISMLPVLKTNSGIVVYEVKVGFDGNPPAWVKPGMSASVDIVTREKNDVITIPSQAIKQNQQGQKTVNVLIDNQSRQTAVETGLSNGAQTEVISGIGEGEVVLLNP